MKKYILLFLFVSCNHAPEIIDLNHICKITEDCKLSKNNGHHPDKCPSIMHERIKDFYGDEWAPEYDEIKKDLKGC